MHKFRLKFSLLESLLVVMLLSILLAFVIQIHRQEIHFPSADLSIPWQILVVFALWLTAWLGRWLRASRRKSGEPGRDAMPGELLLAGSGTAMIGNGLVMILFSRIWSHGTGPDPIRTLFWLAVLFLLFTLGAAATIFYRPMRRRIRYWLLSLLILGAVFMYNFYVMAQTIASV
jgi:hypothetical protein